MSNFLGDVRIPRRLTYFLSSAELIEREGVELHKSMNFRAGDRLPVFLVLERAQGYDDVWHKDSNEYLFRGHDSTIGGEKVHDQVLMYEDGRLSDNGRFFKTARAYEEGVRRTPQMIQVYEKIDSGVWYDKGLFALGAVRETNEGGRMFTYVLTPSEEQRADTSALCRDERMLSASQKATIWKDGEARCYGCASEHLLRITGENGAYRLTCAKDRGEGGGFLD